MKLKGESLYIITGIFKKHSFLKHSISGLIIVLALTVCSSCSRNNRTQYLVGFSEEIESGKFLNPPRSCRSFLFYSLNDRLDPVEIKKQIHGFAEAGIGGFYLHSRAGLLTEYLGNDWWDIMDSAVEAAGETGMYAWFYDEDKWPSGYAGGIIPLMNSDYRARSLARLDRETPLPEGAVVISETDRYRFVSHTAQLGVPIFNGTSYVDLFNPEVVEQFIKVSYTPYIERYKYRSQNGIMGIFSDEPHIHARYFDRGTPHLGVLSFSPTIPEKFIRRNGYDLTDSLHLLFEESGNWRKVRHDYYTTIALQFAESFSKQISDYCEKNGTVFTGHYLGEDGLEKVRDRIGNAMLHYRNMQQPGIDHLGLTIDNRIITPRSLSSVANQYDKPLRTTEIFGICGQNMSFEDRKWLAGWHTVLGVNHFVQHLTSYSLKGSRKRDYPPTFSSHQPYWDYEYRLEDYLGRLTCASVTGRYDPQILVINPLGSEYIKGEADGEFTPGLITLLEALQCAHYDYDLGDEQIMEDIARIKNRKLSIGSMEYQAVYLPDMIGIRKSTLDLLIAFAGKGGLILNSGRFPQYVNGLPNHTALNALKEAVVNLEPREIKDNLPDLLSPAVVIHGKDSNLIWSQVRRSKKGNLVILANISRKDNLRATIHSDLLQGKILLWDPSDGKCFRVEGDGTSGIELEIASSSVVWLSTEGIGDSTEELPLYHLPEETSEFISLNNTWTIKRLHDNSITLDFAGYSTGKGKPFSEPEPVAGIFNRLADQRYQGDLILEFPVHIAEIPSSCHLVVEQPNLFESIRVNGRLVENEWKDHYMDPAFGKQDIGKFLVKGKNNITLRLHFMGPDPVSPVPEERYGTEIESIYLVGDFGVFGNGHFTTRETQRNSVNYLPPRTVHGFSGFTIKDEKNTVNGDLTTEGYPFYAGTFELSQNVYLDSSPGDRSCFLDLTGAEATVMVVSLNGNVIDTVTWSPCHVDISRFLQAGDNNLTVTITNSLRNLLGPHHHPGADLIRVGPNSFTGAGGFPDPSGNRNWYDLRLNKHDLKLWTDTYYHVPFGFPEPLKIVRSGKSALPLN